MFWRKRMTDCVGEKTNKMPIQVRKISKVSVFFNFFLYFVKLSSPFWTYMKFATHFNLLTIITINDTSGEDKSQNQFNFIRCSKSIVQNVHFSILLAFWCSMCSKLNKLDIIESTGWMNTQLIYFFFSLSLSISATIRFCLGFCFRYRNSNTVWKST